MDQSGNLHVEDSKMLSDVHKTRQLVHLNAPALMAQPLNRPEVDVVEDVVVDVVVEDEVETEEEAVMVTKMKMTMTKKKKMEDVDVAVAAEDVVAEEDAVAEEKIEKILLRQINF